jgi:hypothetical protein
MRDRRFARRFGWIVQRVLDGSLVSHGGPPDGLLDSLGGSLDRSAAQPTAHASRLSDRSTRARWFSRFARRSCCCACRIVRRVPDGSVDSLGDSHDSLTGGSPAGLDGSFDACQMARPTSVLLGRAFDVCPAARPTSPSFCKDETGSRTNVGLPYARSRTAAVAAMPSLPPLRLGMLTPAAAAMPSLPPLGFGFLARTSRPPSQRRQI